MSPSERRTPPPPPPPHHERIADPAALPEDLQEEQRLRPLVLGDFVGQTGLKEQLRIFLEAARLRGEALDHVLFHGPPGLGKTTLASILARELGVEITHTSGPVIERPGDLAGLLTPAAAAVDPLWKEAATTSGELSCLVISADGSTIVAGGDQLIALSRDGRKLWTGWSGTRRRISALIDRPLSTGIWISVRTISGRSRR